MIGLIFALATTAPADLVGKLDCSPGFDGVVARIAGAPDVLTTRTGADFRIYEDAAARTVYTVTETPNAAHPTVVKQQAVAVGGATRFEMSACGYGDRSAFEALLSEFEKTYDEAAAPAPR